MKIITHAKQVQLNMKALSLIMIFFQLN